MESEEEKHLLKIHAAGVKWRKMADTLDRTVAACDGRMAKLRSKMSALSGMPLK
jgi:hypothetical protein